MSYYKPYYKDKTGAIKELPIDASTLGGLPPSDYAKTNNIKTINGESIVGKGNIEVKGADIDLSNYYNKTETDEKITDVVEIAEGKTNSYVLKWFNNPSFESNEDVIEINLKDNPILDYRGYTILNTALKIGDIFYIVETNVPDRWLAGINRDVYMFAKMETSKVNLDGNASFVDIGIIPNTIIGDIESITAGLSEIVFRAYEQNSATHVKGISDSGCDPFIAILDWSCTEGTFIGATAKFRFYFEVPYEDEQGAIRPGSIELIDADTYTKDETNDILNNYIRTGTQLEKSIYASYKSMSWYANNYESGLTLQEGNTGLFGGGSSIYLRDNDITVNGKSFNELYSKVQELYGNYITFSIDNSINYTKTVPTNAEQYATVNKVGGMSYKSNNLLVLDDVAETTTNGITYSVKDGVITLNGTATKNMSLYYFVKELLKTPINSLTYNNTVFITGKKSETIIDLFVALYDGTSYSTQPVGAITNNVNENTTYSKSFTYSGNNYLRGFSMYVRNGTIFTNYQIRPMLVSGSTVPNKWENGFKGLRNAVTNKVKVIGVNLLGGMQFLGNGYINGNTGEITNTTSAKMYDYFPVGSNTKILIKIGNYTSLTNAYACRIGEYDINKTFIKNTVIASSSHIITFDGATKYIRLSIDAKATSIMLSFDTTLTEYIEPKYNVLPINAIVTNINQSNLMENTTFELGQINDDGTLSGTSSGEGYSGRTIQYIPVRPSTSYVYKDIRTLTASQNTIMYIVEYDSAKNFIQKKLHQNALNNMLYTTTFTTTERTAYVKFGYIFEYTLTNAPINCVLVEGTDLTKVSYYGLGVNSNCYNYIDLDNNKYIQRVASYTFTSSDTVLQIDTNTTGIYRYMFSGLKGIIKSCASNVIANIVMENLESITVDHTYQPTSEGIGVGPNGDLIFYKSNIQTTADAKEFLVGKTIIYELAEPIITSLTYEYDNIIEVEPNGTIIFENEYQYDVPSEIEYQVKAGN